MGNCSTKSKKYRANNPQLRGNIAYNKSRSSLDNISNNRSLRYVRCGGSEEGNSRVFMRTETSQSSRGSRRGRNRSLCEDQLSLSKTRWPIPQSEATFLPEFKIKETASKSEFEFVEVISKGAYGQVYKVRSRKGGEIFALKVLDKAQIISEDAVERVKDEVHIQQVVGHHPFVVNASCHWQDKRKLYVGSSYVSGGELYSLVEEYGSLPEDAVRILVAEVALAIDFLHNAGIIHRDIKASNVLLDNEGHAQLIDFGFAKWLSRGQKTWTLCGTPRYIAPEILRREGYGHAVDWWSLGVLMFFLLTADYPATPATQSEELPTNGIVSELPLPRPEDAPISPTARDLVKRLLEPDPALRLRSIFGLQRVGFYQNRDFRGYTCRSVSPLEYLPITKERSTANEGRGISNKRGDPFAGFSDSSILLDSL